MLDGPLREKHIMSYDYEIAHETARDIRELSETERNTTIIRTTLRYQTGPLWFFDQKVAYFLSNLEVAHYKHIFHLEGIRVPQ